MPQHGLSVHIGPSFAWDASLIELYSNFFNRYILINNIWDRIEKVIYLFIDALLNWYFLKVVKANLINNGLQKYNKLLRFNQKIIILSLLMDVMIIGAMSIPNTFM